MTDLSNIFYLLYNILVSLINKTYCNLLKKTNVVKTPELKNRKKSITKY